MTPREVHDPELAAGLLARARAVAPGARLCFELLAVSLASQLGSESSGTDVGAILDTIAARKLYRLGGYATFDAFVRAALGISRAKAHRLRTLARASDVVTVPRELTREKKRAVRRPARRG